MDWTSLGSLEESPREWFQDWEQMGIEMQSIDSETYYWQDYEVLRHFAEHGVRQFWVDDIWDFDWEKCRIHALSIGVSGIPQTRISTPPKLMTILLPLLDKSFVVLKSIRSLMG
jgi:hypothetical protein